MPKPIFNDLALKAASLALDGLALRQRATANNIANIDTPGYKARQVDFEHRLRRLTDDDTDPNLPLKATNANHLQRTPSTFLDALVIRQQNNTLRNDGNNVDIDIEMTTLAETTLRYQALTQLAANKLALLKSIIRG